MASEPPYPIDDEAPPDDATASDAENTSPPNDQSTALAAEISADPDPAPDPTSTIPYNDNDNGAAMPPPAVASDSVPAPTASSGQKSVRGGNMSMRVLSRAMQDLDVITGGTRAATYDEVDEYVGRAIRTERALENKAMAVLARDQARIENGGGPIQPVARATPDMPFVAPPGTSIRGRLAAASADHLIRTLATSTRSPTGETMKANFTANAMSPIPATAQPSQVSAAHHTSSGQKPAPVRNIHIPATSVYMVKDRAAWNLRRDHYLDARRAAGLRLDPTQDAIERKSLDDDWKRIESGEAQRFQNALNNSGRIGELIMPAYGPITEALAIAIETRAGYSDTAMTQDQLKTNHPINAANAYSLGKIAESDTAREYPGQRSWRNEADAFKHADWTIRLQRRMGTAEAQQIEDGHESEYPIHGDLMLRGDRLQDITNNHNLRILSEMFPDISPSDLARMAIRAGLAQTKIYTIIPTPAAKSKSRKKRSR